MCNLFRLLKRGARVFIGPYYLILVCQNYLRCGRFEEFLTNIIQQFVKIVIYILQVEGNLDNDNNIILLKEKNHQSLWKNIIIIIRTRLRKSGRITNDKHQGLLHVLRD